MEPQKDYDWDIPLNTSVLLNSLKDTKNSLEKISEMFQEIKDKIGEVCVLKRVDFYAFTMVKTGLPIEVLEALQIDGIFYALETPSMDEKSYVLLPCFDGEWISLLHDKDSYKITNMISGKLKTPTNKISQALQIIYQ
jgi:hypothetical protein